MSKFSKKIKNILNKNELSEDNIVSMVNESTTQGILETNEAEMINNIFELNDKEAKDIMTNRSQLIGIDSQTSLTDAIDIMLNESYSRYPVYEDNMDHIIGILHLKDAVRYYNSNKKRVAALQKYNDLLRPAKFIPETVKIDDLFTTMQSEKIQMVIIVDEYGQTSGVVAMEDILEEIVGNIMDEYDKDENHILHKDINVYKTEGLTPLKELEKELNIEFDTENFETLNGFIISVIEHIPENDEQIEVTYKGYHFKVCELENRMIKDVMISKISENINDNIEDAEVNL